MIVSVRCEAQHRWTFVQSPGRDCSHVGNLAGELARVGTAEGELSVRDGEGSRRLEGDTDQLVADQALCECGVEDGGNFAAARGRAFREVNGTDAIECPRSATLGISNAYYVPKDTIDTVKSEGELRDTDGLLREDQVAQGDGIDVFFAYGVRRAG